MEIVSIALFWVGGIAVCALAQRLATSRSRIMHDTDEELGIANLEEQITDRRASRAAGNRDEAEPIGA